MKPLITEQDYKKANLLLDELLKKTEKITDINNPLLKELDKISDIIGDYEDIHYPIGNEKKSTK